MPLQLDLSKHASSHMHECIHECALAHSHAYLSMRIFPLVPCHASKVWFDYPSQSEWHYYLRRSPETQVGTDSFLAFALDFAFLFAFSSASKHQSQCHTYGPMAMLQRALAEHVQVSVSTSSTRQAKSQTFTLLQCFYLPQHVCQHPKWLREPFRQRSLDELHIC